MADPKKISDTEIEMEKVVPETRTIVRYERKFIESQRTEIIKQRDAYVVARNVELAEVDAILKAMDDAGVTGTAVQP